MKILRRLLIVLGLLLTLFGALGIAQAKTPVPAPLTGTITTSSWLSYDKSFSGITLACGKPFHFNVVLPPQYDGTKYTYPLYIWLHPDHQGDAWYLGGASATFLSNDEGGSYNTTAWMTKYPAIYVLPYADQTNGNGTNGSCNSSGDSAILNWGGWFHTGSQAGSGTVYSGDTGPNTFALLSMVAFLESTYSVNTSEVIVNGFSLGAIGAGYLCQHYNAYNGSPAIFSACLELGGGVDEADTPVDSGTETTMKNVPTWYFSGANDGASNPGDYNTPLCNGLGGPPTSTAITSPTANQCGTSQMHYTLCPSCGHQDTDASGNPVWTNTVMNDFAFSVSAGTQPLTQVWDNPGADGRYWKLPQQTTAVIDTTSLNAKIMRNGAANPNSGVAIGSINLPGNYSVPFYYGAKSTDPTVTIKQGTKTFSVHMPLGAVIEQPSTGVDSSVGGTDQTQPGLVWSISNAGMTNASGQTITSVQSSGTTITGTYGQQIDWGYGPFMEDAVTGQPGFGNAYGVIQDVELSRANADPNYVIPHTIQIQMDVSQCNTSILWPLSTADGGAKYTGPLSQGYTIMIPASTQRPANMTRGQSLLFDTFQQYGGLVYNFGYTGGGLNMMVFSTDPANATLLSDIVNNWPWAIQYMGLLTNQTGPSTAKGMVNGVRSDAFPAPPLLDLTPTGGVEVSSSTVGAYYSTTTLPYSVASGGFTNPAPIQPVQTLSLTTPTQQFTNVPFSVNGSIGGYTNTPTLNYEVDAGAFLALPAGASVTPNSVTFTVPGLTAGSHTLSLRDASNITVSTTTGAFSVTAAVESANNAIVTTTRTTPTFADSFTSLSLHQAWQSGDNWQLIAPDTPNGRGGPNFGEFGTQWWTNPYNPSTPISGLYTQDANGLHLGLQSTPAADQSYINTQSGTTLPYVAALLNSSQTNYQQYGYWETTVAVPAIPGFTFQSDAENVSITGTWPPEIDLRIYTDAGGVQTVLFQFSLDSTGNNYYQYTTSSSSGFNASLPHIYAWDWETTGITFYIDDVQVATSALPVGQGYTNNPMFLYLLSASNYINTVNPATASLPTNATVKSVNIYAAKPVTTPSGNIVDATGEVFTASVNDQIAVNGVPDTTTSGVVQLAYVNHAVWYQNVYNLWYYKTQSANTWQPIGGTLQSPLVITQSPNNTIITTVGPQIIDTNGTSFALTAGAQVSINGTADTTTSGAIELAFVNGVVWREDGGANWYSYLGSPGSWSAATQTSPLPSRFMTIDPIVTQTAGVAFTVTGSEIGVATVPALQYQDNAGAWTAFPIGSTVALSVPTTFSDTLNPIDITGSGGPPLGTVQTVLAGSGNTFNSGGTWSISTGGQAFLNGALPNGQFSASVAKLVLVLGTVWMENTSNQWYSWTGTAWAPGADPTAGGVLGSWLDHYPFGGSEYTLSANNEAQCYTSSTRTPGFNPFSLTSGVFTITADTAAITSFYPQHTPTNTCGLPYSSGAITTATEPSGYPLPGLFGQLYGYFASKMLLPKGTGLWPAFWMEPLDGVSACEIDIMEALGNDTGTIYTTLHYATSTSADGGVATVSDYSQNWHEYAVDWESDNITWYIDSVQVFQRPTPSSCKTSHYLMANLAVGATGSWPGPPTASTIFPATMQVAYFKAYASKPAAGTGSTALWSFINPALSSNPTNTVSVRDAALPTINTTSNGFAVTSTETLAINTIGAQVAGSPFIVSGTILNASAVPTLQYQDNGGTWINMPAGGVNLTSFSFTNPALVANPAASIAVRDANAPTITATASFTVNTVVASGAIWDPLNTSSTIALSNNNLTASSTAATRGGTRSVTSQSAGKYCYLGTLGTTTANTAFGLANGSFSLAGSSALGANANSFGFYGSQPGLLQGALYNSVQVLPSTVAMITPGVGSMTDGSGNVWTILSAGAVLMEGSVQVNGGGSTGAFTIVNGVYYAQDINTLVWYTYSPVTTNFTPSAAPTAVADVANDNITMCVNLNTQLAWISSTAMRKVAGVTWNNSLTADPVAGTGGVPFSGLLCPCYVAMDTPDNLSQMTLNSVGPFTPALPSGYLVWQTTAAITHHPFLYIFGRNTLANDNDYFEPVSFGRMAR